jgi:hypothetical protein
MFFKLNLNFEGKVTLNPADLFKSLDISLHIQRLEEDLALWEVGEFFD